MLLSDWNDLTDSSMKIVEDNEIEWAVQIKLDGVRTLLHVKENGVRITGRNISDVTYRLTEHQANVAHLCEGLEDLTGTIFDGELVCPIDQLNTGDTVTTSSLQAAVAILATTPEKARAIQQGQSAHLQLHVFDILIYRGEDITSLPLIERLQYLELALLEVNNPNIHLVESYLINKASIHENALATGEEGTVWKKLDQPYEIGRRVPHWIKRKRGLEMEAFVTNYKLGTPDRGHGNLVGAVEFSVNEPDGTSRSIAWISSWTDRERSALTVQDSDGSPMLNDSYLGRTAIISGQDIAGRSQRIRHARLKQWC